MTVFPPRHVLCLLGTWDDFTAVRSAVAACGEGLFTFDEEYSQLSPDPRMPTALEASQNRFDPTLTDDDWAAIGSHRAVAYILSPPLQAVVAEDVSAMALLLIASLFQQGAVAAKSDSAGLAHGRERWLELARRYISATRAGDAHSAASALYAAWVQRPIHDRADGRLYSVGMHLLGHRDTEIDDSVDPETALDWIDLMGLYLVADKPKRPLRDGEGFRLTDEGPRRVIRLEPCRRYAEDDFFHNPYGYHRLASDDRPE